MTQPVRKDPPEALETAAFVVAAILLLLGGFVVVIGGTAVTLLALAKVAEALRGVLPEAVGGWIATRKRRDKPASRRE